MQTTYKPLGEYIQPVIGRNNDLEHLPLVGLSISKEFIPSIANTIGTDMSTYRTIYKNQFAYSAVTSRNGDKLTIALFKDFEKALISQAYTPFEIIDKNKLLPEYLMMWFSRAEFDRYARFKSHGSARELFSWEDLCESLMPVPSLSKQKEIVAEYNAVQKRIDLNKQLIQKLEETAQAIYKHWFVEGIDEISGTRRIDEVAEIKGGKRLPKQTSLNSEKSGSPYVKVADMNANKFIVLGEKIEFVRDEIQKSIARYIVETGDVIISIVGTIGLVNIIDETLHKANLTENCFRLTNFKNINADYLYYFLTSGIGKNEIESRTVGGVQGKLPMYNLASMPIKIPNSEAILRFTKIIDPINRLQKSLSKEIQKLLELKDLLLSKLATVI